MSLLARSIGWWSASMSGGYFGANGRAPVVPREAEGNDASYGRTILVAAANHDFREYLGRVLARSSLGASVLSAGTLDQALDMAAALRPALVILDEDLPGTDGALFPLRVPMEPPAGIPLILLSGPTSSKTSHAAVTAVLSKPFNARSLLAMVRCVLNTNKRPGHP